MAVIEALDVTKRFGAIRVLEGFTLRVDEGEVYGLLGPNGAGKSTLVHLLLGFLRPNSGRIQILGASPDVARARIGYLPEHARYHSQFTPREYLRALGEFSNMTGPALADRSRSVLELVGLWGHADRRLGVFSKGMLQRLGIAQALLHDPALLLVDEPTSGLDPAGQREMTDLLGELRQRGHTILMCTHQIAEVEVLCDRVGVLGGGRLAAEARINDLAASHGVTILAKQDSLPETVLSGLRTLGSGVKVAGREVWVSGDEALQRLALRLLLDAEVTVAEVKPSEGGVEQLYLSVVRGKALSEAVPPLPDSAIVGKAEG